MEIAFHSRSLRDICESEAMLTKRFGKRVGQKIKRRLADLRAATSIEDLPLGNPRQLPGKLQPTMALDLCDGFSLTFRSNHVRRGTPTGRGDWSEVSRIKIMTIGRDND
jgi:plasmid maintenance system killer protein